VFWASYVILIALIILQVLSPTVQDPFRRYTTLIALAVILVLNILWDDIEALFSRPDTGDWVLLVVTSILTFYTIVVGQNFNSVYLIFMIVAQANAMLPFPPAFAFSLLLIAAFFGTLIQMGISKEALGGTLLGVIIGMTFTISLSHLLQRYYKQTQRANELLEQLRQANAELLAARQKEKELAIAEERVRMARDLHDGLGHHLTALSIQLQAAEKLVQTSPQMAAEAVHNARGEVQAALKEVRQSVAVMREAPIDIEDLPQAIENLVMETGRRINLRASFLQEGQRVSLSPATAMTLYRTTQEGLTNVQKHAQAASEVCVRLVYCADSVSLSVEDDGRLPAPEPGEDECQGQPGSFGLAGLRERADLLGGTLDCGARPQGGFLLRISLPCEAKQGEKA
jgi:signal transduction histidine kinase